MIEKLERYNHIIKWDSELEINTSGFDVSPCGDWVEAKVALAREDTLLKALKDLCEYENGCDDLMNARKVIKEIEETR